MQDRRDWVAEFDRPHAARRFFPIVFPFHHRHIFDLCPFGADADFHELGRGFVGPAMGVNPAAMRIVFSKQIVQLLGMLSRDFLIPPFPNQNRRIVAKVNERIAESVGP